MNKDTNFEDIKDVAALLITSGADVFDIKNEYSETVYDRFDKELREYFQTDATNKTVYCPAKLTKAAVKK